MPSTPPHVRGLRRDVARVAALAVIAAIAGACSNGPTRAPSAAHPSPTVATAARSAGPSASAPVGSTTPAASSAGPGAVPSGTPNAHMVPALENLLPDLYNGAALKKTSFDGTALGADPASLQLKNFLSVNGKSLTEFSEAGASDPKNAGNLTFVVFRVQGMDGSLLLQAIVAATVAASPAVQMVPATVANRQLIKGTDAAGVRYIEVKGGFVYGLQSNSQDTADRALAQLP